MADSLERCPKCGMPYMSGMLSNETAKTRYCYTCDVEKGRNATAERAEHAAEAALDDLSLQNEGVIDAKFAKRRVTNLRAQVVATARAKPKPQAQQAAQPVQPPPAKGLEDLQINTVTSATSNPPPPPRKLHLKKRGSGPVLPVIGILAAILLAFFVVKNLVVKPEPEAAAPEPVKAPPPKPKPVAAPTKPKPPPPPKKEEKPEPNLDEYDIVTGKKLVPAKPKQPSN